MTERRPAPRPAPPAGRPARRPQPAGADADSLLDRLKALRNQLAQRQHLPAYVIFTNASLTEMAEKRPRTTGDFLRISGVGDARARRYGMEFLRVIAEYQREHPEE